MDRVAHIRLLINQPVEARRGLLLAIHNRLNTDSALGGKALPPALDAGGEPYVELALPETLDEDAAQARVCGLAYEFGIHADAVDLTFGPALEGEIYRLSLDTDDPPPLRTPRLERLRAALAAQPGVLRVGPLSHAGQSDPFFEAVFAAGLDEASVEAWVEGAAFSVGIAPGDYFLTLMRSPAPAGTAIVRLAVPGPLTLEERNDEYERLKRVGEALRGSLITGKMRGDGVFVDLLLNAPLGAGDLSSIVVLAAGAVLGLGGDPGRVTIRILPEGSHSRELREPPAGENLPAVARLAIRPAGAGEPTAIAVAQRIAQHLCWRELARATGTGHCTTWLEIPAAQRHPARAMPAISTALTAAEVGPDRVRGLLLPAVDALDELTAGDPARPTGVPARRPAAPARQPDPGPRLPDGPQLFALLVISNRLGEGPYSHQLRGKLLEELGRMGWAEPARVSRAEAAMRLVVQAPHFDPMRAGRELAEAITVTDGARPRVQVRLLNLFDALQAMAGLAWEAERVAPPDAWIRRGGLDARQRDGSSEDAERARAFFELAARAVTGEPAALAQLCAMSGADPEAGFVQGADPGGLVQAALGRLLADGEAWDRQRRYGTGPVRGPADGNGDGWTMEEATGTMLDGGRVGLLRDAQTGGTTLVEWETGIFIHLSAQGAQELLAALQCPAS